MTPELHTHCAPDDARWRELRRELAGFVGRRVASEADAEDIVQETLVRVHRGFPDLNDATRLGPWMTSIARNAIVDHYRQRGSRDRRRDAVAADPTLPDHTPPPPDPDPAPALAGCLAPFVDALDEPYRSALRLVDLEGLSQRDAATQLGLPYSTLKSHVQRGRARLRADVEDCCRVELDSRNHVVDVVPRRADGCCPS